MKLFQTYWGKNMSNHYNPWPLGSLPEEMQRPEPKQLQGKGYNWDDPRDIVDLFEAKLAKYAGSKYAVLTDSCTNAIFLCLKLKDISGQVEIPAQTYVSVPMQIFLAGATPVFREIEWTGLYQLGETGIWDSAARFTQGMYVDPGALQCLSFQIKKRLPIGRGGAILTNDFEAYTKLKMMTYDGRDLKTPYTSKTHVQGLGWHNYMTPEDAARGILLMDMLPEQNEDTMTHSHYPDLRDWPAVLGLTKQNSGR
jgi:dTDP-4-amino-4,6-dideoxygalactose transaminase